MNWDYIGAHWSVFKGRIREKWGKLSNDDTEIVNGRIEQLLGLLQRRYAIDRQAAERQVQEFCDECEADD